MEPKGNDMADELVERLEQYAKDCFECAADQRAERPTEMPVLYWTKMAADIRLALARLSRPSTAEAEPFAWVVIAEPNLPWSFCRKREEAEHTAHNLLTYRSGCTSARIEPLFLGHPSLQGGAEPAAKTFVNCTCHDDVSRRLCLKKGTCSVTEALYTHPIGETGGPAEQLDRIFIGGGEYVRADEAVKTVTALNKRIQKLEAPGPADAVSEAEVIDVLGAMLRHSCVSDTVDADKFPEDIEAERKARKLIEAAQRARK